MTLEPFISRLEMSFFSKLGHKNAQKEILKRRLSKNLHQNDIYLEAKLRDKLNLATDIVSGITEWKLDLLWFKKQKIQEYKIKKKDPVKQNMYCYFNPIALFLNGYLTRIELNIHIHMMLYLSSFIFSGLEILILL